MFCTKCGNQLADGSKFCARCGAAVSAYVPTAAPVQPTPPPAQPRPMPAAPQTTHAAAMPFEAEAKKKKRNGLIVGLIAAILAIAALACAFFFWVYPTFLSDAAKYEKAMEAAEAALGDDDYSAAIVEYSTALNYAADDEQKIDVYLSRAEACVEAEEYEDAIADYEEVLDIDEDQKKVWALMAEAYVALGDNEKAIEVLNEGYEATDAENLLEKIDEIEADAFETGEAGATEIGEADDAVVQAPEESEAQQPDAPAVEERPETVEIGGYTFYTDETWLDLEDMDLNNADIEPLVYFTDLEALYMDGNNISDLSPLADLQNLCILSLYDNEVSDISPLAGLYKLEELCLWSNPIEDITPLSGLENLTYLDLDDTLVSDVSPLFGLSNLETLYISGENLPDDAWDVIYATLPQFAPEEPESVGAEFGYDTLYFGMSDLIPYEYMTSDPFQDFCYITCEMLCSELGVSPEPITFSEPDVSILEALAAGEIDCALVRLPIENNEDLFEAYGLAWTAPIVETSDGSLVICVRGDDYAMLEMLNTGIEMMHADGMMEELKAIWEEFGLSVWY